MIVEFVNAGRIPVEQSAANALASWANENERKLCGMGLGRVLDGTRHRVWAHNKMLAATIHCREYEHAGRRIVRRWVEI